MAHSGENPTKAALRKELLQARTSLSTDLANAAIATRAIEFAKSHSAKTVATYLSFGAEPATKQIIADLLASGIQVLVPAVAENHTMRWYVFDGASVAIGALNFAEPDETKLREIDLSTAQLLFMPALAVDLRGARLGRGGGYFDRALSDLSDEGATATLKVALVYDAEVLDVLPTDDHDKSVDFAITELRLIEF
jgi:5-formyltetrahydrofolate cyclo-ligase